MQSVGKLIGQQDVGELASSVGAPLVEAVCARVLVTKDVVIDFLRVEPVCAGCDVDDRAGWFVGGIDSRKEQTVKEEMR